MSDALVTGQVLQLHVQHAVKYSSFPHARLLCVELGGLHHDGESYDVRTVPHGLLPPVAIIAIRLGSSPDVDRPPAMCLG